MNHDETREYVVGMRARFDRDVKPLLIPGRYSMAAGQLSSLLGLILRHQTDIEDLPGGINYLLSLGFLNDDLSEGKEPRQGLMEEYDAYAAQVTMPRSE